MSNQWVKNKSKLKKKTQISDIWTKINFNQSRLLVKEDKKNLGITL